jgi:uncharacterized protein (UPF0332 family)
VSPLTEARAHLAKATEFLHAAELAADMKPYNAATSNAVTSGINAKDAICLKMTGKTGKSDAHADAVGELRRPGASSSHLATSKRLSNALSRLLSVKSRSQYESKSVSRTAAGDALGCARTLLEGAESLVNQT